MLGEGAEEKDGDKDAKRGVGMEQKMGRGRERKGEREQ